MPYNWMNRSLQNLACLIASLSLFFLYLQLAPPHVSQTFHFLTTMSKDARLSGEVRKGESGRLKQDTDTSIVDKRGVCSQTPGMSAWEGRRTEACRAKFLKVKVWEPFLKWVEKEKHFIAPWALKSWQGEITWKLVLFGWPFFSSVNSQCKLLKSVALTPNELQFFSLGTQFGGMRRMGLGSQKPWDGTRTNPSHYFSFTHYPATPTGLETVVALANRVHGRKDEISPVSNSTALSLRQLQTS